MIMSSSPSADLASQFAEIRYIARQLGEQLLLKNHRITTAESCTGGGIAQAITDIAGSSQWFSQGYVVYSNHAKQQLLKVSEQALAHGAVSQAVVEAMAVGALKDAGADISIAVSGIAGPDGGSIEKPVGTVWIAWATSDNSMRSRCYQFVGDRQQIRHQAVIASLKEAMAITRD